MEIEPLSMGVILPSHYRLKTLVTMDTPAFVATIFVWCLLLSITGYSLYIGFGPPSKDLRDPFEEHED